jgi:hypothetical protein
MPEAPHEGTKGIGGILRAQTGPLPNWVWILVIAGGGLAAYFIPKFLAQNSTSAPDATSTNAGTSNSGLGLAVDPTTGLPYAVEGLVPSGGTVATQSGVPPPAPPPAPTTTPTPTPIAAPNPNYPLLPPGTTIPNTPGAQYQYAGQWYTIVPGSEGRIWGALGKLSLQAAQNAPIQEGSKILLIEPASKYSPAWPGNTTQTRVA